MKAVVAAFNQEKALVGAFSVITNLRMQLFEALLCYIWLPLTHVSAGAFSQRAAGAHGGHGVPVPRQPAGGKESLPQQAGHPPAEGQVRV